MAEEAVEEATDVKVAGKMEVREKAATEVAGLKKGDKYNSYVRFPLNNMMEKLLKGLFVAVLCLSSFACFSQKDSAGIVTVVSLDEFVVNASVGDLDVEDFIRQVREDTTFYQAFLNLKYFPHKIDGAMVVFEKDESEKGTLVRQAQQHLNSAEEMWVEITYEKSNRKIQKKNGEWKYLTAEFYDDIFFPQYKHKVSNRIDQLEQELEGTGAEKHKAQLKRMMFNPGSEIGNVPFIGDKMAIFDKEMVGFYDFNIYQENYADSIPCIVFSCQTKEGQEGETVIRDLTSYFKEDTREIIAREYTLAHKTILFDFDITIKVENFTTNGYLLPSNIKYNGYWNVPFKKPEIIAFQLRCYDYNTAPLK